MRNRHGSTLSRENPTNLVTISSRGASRVAGRWHTSPMTSQPSESISPDEVLPPQGADEATETESPDFISQPAKVMRIGSMVKNLLDEARSAPLDEGGRRRLKEIYEQSVRELSEALSSDLSAELSRMVLPFTDEVPSESELRVAQAQLVGWLEGLFHGIQASLFAQQAAAAAQLEQMRQRELTSSGNTVTTPGTYL